MLTKPNTNKERISSFPRDILEQAEIVKHGWDEVGVKLQVPNLSVDKFVEKLAEAREQAERAEALKAERAHAIQLRNRCMSELWDLTKRIRNAAKATFGDYSEEFEALVNARRQKF